MTTARFEFRLDSQSGVPVYRQLIDQVLIATATGSLTPGAQLPTVRQVAVELAINPNTVVRAYRELEIRGVLETQQGTGTFISSKKVEHDEAERQRRLTQLVAGFVAQAAAQGFSMDEIRARLAEMAAEPGGKGHRP